MVAEKDTHLVGFPSPPAVRKDEALAGSRRTGARSDDRVGVGGVGGVRGGDASGELGTFVELKIVGCGEASADAAAGNLDDRIGL